MDEKIKRRISWISMLLALFILSYWREVLFMSINAIIEGETFFYAKTTNFSFLRDIKPAKLIVYKYFLTIALTVAFFTLTFLGTTYGFKNRLAKKLTILFYLVIFILVLILLFLSLLFQQHQTFYPYLRILVGWIHSPLIFLFISIVVYSTNTLNNKVF
jgi:hypothetical protein